MPNKKTSLIRRSLTGLWQGLVNLPQRLFVGSDRQNDREPPITTLDWNTNEDPDSWTNPLAEATPDPHRLDASLETKTRAIVASPGPDSSSFLRGLSHLTGLEYLSSQELLTYIAWKVHSSLDLNSDLSVEAVISTVQWGDEGDEKEHRTETSVAVQQREYSFIHPRPFLLGLSTIPNLEWLSSSQLLQTIAWESDALAGQTASEADLRLLGDLIAEFPEE